MEQLDPFYTATCTCIVYARDGEQERTVALSKLFYDGIPVKEICFLTEL